MTYLTTYLFLFSAIYIVTVVYVKTRTINDHTIAVLNEHLSKESWESVLNLKEVNAAYDEYIKIFSKMYDTCCPVKTVTFHQIPRQAMDY